MNAAAQSNEQLSPLQRAALTIKQLRAKLDSLEQSQHSPIAIVGLGCRFPGGADTPEAYWRLLAEAVDCVGPIPPERWDREAYYDAQGDTAGKIATRHGCFLRQVEDFDPDFFGLSPREAASLDPQHRLLLEVGWEALEHAGIPAAALRGSQTGVFVGIGQNDYAQRRLYGPDPSRIDTYDGTGNGFCFAPGRIAHWLGLNGPNLAIDTACSSSLVAVHLACQSLRLHECDLALAGGVQLILSPEVTVFLSRAHALAPDGRCKTFDGAADGYGRGEGCGMVVLKRLADAVAAGDAVAAVIRGSALNHNGPGSGLTVPNGAAQQAVLRQALAAARIAPAQMDYLETHGTGTALGDPVELRSLDAVMAEGRSADRPLFLGAVKTNIGHLEAAAGIAGLIKTALALEKGLIPPNLHCRSPNPAIPWDRARVSLPPRLMTWPARGATRIAGVSSFGISGTNAHVVLEQGPPAPAGLSASARPLHLLSLSAKSPKALAEQARRLAEYWDEHPEGSLEDLCFSANTGRSHHAQRLALLAEGRESLRSRLHQAAEGATPASVFRGLGEEPLPLAGLFTGQGSHYRGMGLELYRTAPRFREVLDQCARLLGSRLSPSLPELLGDSSGLLDQTAYAQPVLFALEYALAELWAEWGIRPAAQMGHSVGEYVAACRAGVFGLEEGLALVAERGRLMQALPATGLMAAVAAEPERVLESLARYSGRVSIAALNGPGNTVISGERGAVEALLEQFAAAQIKVKRLKTSHAFHSPLLEPMLDAFEAFAGQFRYAPPQSLLVSNLSGELAGSEIADANYWRRHARQPVLFARGMETLARQGFRAFLEMGPNPVLLGMGSQVLAEGEDLWLPSLRENHPDWEQMLASLARLYTEGGEPDWEGFHRHDSRRRLRLPTYPFQRRRHWIEGERKSAPAAPGTYRLAWRERALPARVGEAAPDGTWLLMGDRSGLAENLSGALAGQEPVTVRFGEDFARLGRDHWMLNPARPDDFSRLLRELPARPRGIVCLWSGQSPAHGDDPGAGSSADCAALVRLSQALLEQGPAQTKLWLVTRNAMPVEAGAPMDLSHACLWGLGKVLALEHPELWGGMIDLDGRGDEVRQILAELEAGDGEDHVAWRGGRRHGERLEAFAGAPPTRVPIRADGSYLISGGYGALGLHVANWLAEQGARHLILLGRREPGPAVQEKLERLREVGVNLMLVQADVAEVEELRRVFSRIADQLPPLRGIFHGAGVAGARQALAQLDPLALSAVFRPKLDGAWNLHRLSLDLKLDLFVCFSSIASAWGSAAQADYAAANQFLDSLAHFRRGLGLPALSLNWGPWEGGGMAASAELRQRLAAMGLGGLPAQQALAAMGELLGSSCPQLIVADVDWPRFKALYTARRPRPLLEGWGDGAPEPEAPAGGVKLLEALAPKERLDWLLALVRREAAAVLGRENEPVDGNKGFFSLGLDSLMAVELKDRLVKALRVPLPATLAFDHPTPLALAVHLGAEVLGLELGRAAGSSTRQGEAPAGRTEERLPQDSLADRLAQIESLLRAG